MEYLTTKQVAQRLNVHIKTVRKLIRTGQLQSFKLSDGRTGAVRIAEADLERFVAERQEAR